MVTINDIWFWGRWFRDAGFIRNILRLFALSSLQMIHWENCGIFHYCLQLVDSLKLLRNVLVVFLIFPIFYLNLITSLCCFACLLVMLQWSYLLLASHISPDHHHHMCHLAFAYSHQKSKFHGGFHHLIFVRIYFWFQIWHLN